MDLIRKISEKNYVHLDPNKTKDPFFIVGNSRSGTTLLARILRSHSSIYVLKETFFYDDLWREIGACNKLTDNEIRQILNRMYTIQEKGYYRRNETREYREDVDIIINLFKEFDVERNVKNLIKLFFVYQASLRGKTISGDQTPRHVFAIKGLNELFPDSKYLNMIRDPRAVILSQKNKWKATIRLKQPLFETIRTKLNYHPITIALLWNRAIESGIRAELALGQEKIKSIKFEDLVKESKKTVSGITQFLGLTFEEKMLEVSVEMSSNKECSNVKGIDSTIADVWEKKLSPTEIYLCEFVSKKYLNEFNYKITEVSPNYLLLLWYLFSWPIQIGVAFIVNVARIGNPITYLKQRLLVK